jgi:hypothetical protein
MFFDDLPLYSQQPIEVLTHARVHGAAWHERLCSDAAYYGDFELLKRLHKSGCPWDALFVASNAITGQRGQHELILLWLLGTVEELSQVSKNKLFVQAGTVADIRADASKRSNVA